jgi:hypothetical protein
MPEHSKKIQKPGAARWCGAGNFRPCGKTRRDVSMSSSFKLAVKGLTAAT